MIDRWTLTMAWRDSRGSRRRLGLFLASMVLGVAALVAINSFGESLEGAVDEQAKMLLGADLSLEADTPYDPQTRALIDSLGGDQAERISFASMAYFPATEGTRLSSIRAFEGGYPYYGQLETDPPEAAARYLEDGEALVDGTLLSEFDVEVGDSVQVGNVRYRIAGELLKTPSESVATSMFSPRIYLPIAGLDTTLISFGSRVEYTTYFRFRDGRDAEALGDSLRPPLRERKVGVDTIGEEQEEWGERLRAMYRFLGLVGFIALLLGGLGVGSAIHVYVKGRLETVAVLRCLGAKTQRTVGVYLVQAAALGVLGSAAGCLVGVAVQTLLPRVLGDFLPVDVAFSVSPGAVATGFGVGVGVTVLFALLPLLAVRRVSPLRAIRAAYDEQSDRDPLRWAIYGLLGVGLTAFALLQAPDVRVGAVYAAVIALVFGLLALVAKALMVGARRFFPSSWPYVWRQGLANLYRPSNQTVLLMLALGLGTFLIMTLVLIERSLLQQFDVAGGAGRPDVILFDVQPEQRDGVRAILADQAVPVLDASPIVTMRLASIKGRTIDDLRADSTFDLTWAHTREYRSSYRDALTDAETLVAGAFDGSAEALGGGVVPISIERDLAETELDVGLGDTLVWDVQGLRVPSVVTSIREVDWQQMRTNFFVVFPEGVLEEAPQMHVLMARTGSDDRAAALQRELVQAYPNVSAISLGLVLSVFDEIFGRVSFIVRFMALFSILTGLIVLAGAVLVSRYQRVEESVLLKTLGASRKQVLRIMTAEYLFLGVFATLTGLVLAYGASWGLARFVFETPLVVAPLALAGALVVVTGLTLAIGLLNSRGIYARPPLEVLRAEV